MTKKEISKRTDDIQSPDTKTQPSGHVFVSGLKVKWGEVGEYSRHEGVGEIPQTQGMQPSGCIPRAWVKGSEETPQSRSCRVLRVWVVEDRKGGGAAMLSCAKSRYKCYAELCLPTHTYTFR